MLQQRKAFRTGLAAAAVVLGFGCSTDQIAGPRDFRQLALAEIRWHARVFEDYTYDVRSACFCPPELSRWTRVAVRAGRVIAAVPVTPDPFLPNTTLRYWEPVDSIFADLRRQMAATNEHSFFAKVTVRFDGELGFPTSIVYQAKAGVMDAGGTLELRNVRPL